MHARGEYVTDKRPEAGPRPSVLNRLNDEADRQWHPLTPPAWITPVGVILMIAIVVVVGIAIRMGA